MSNVFFLYSVYWYSGVAILDNTCIKNSSYFHFFQNYQWEKSMALKKTERKKNADWYSEKNIYISLKLRWAKQWGIIVGKKNEVWRKPIDPNFISNVNTTKLDSIRAEI